MAGFKKFVETSEPTTELYVPTVLKSTGCAVHNVPQGVPCYHIPKDSGSGYYAGICNNRALSSGFTSEIDPRSLNNSFSRSQAKGKKPHAKRS